ncbi:hypothetical protein F8388_016959 [Cannabis sativa]|uniref:Protein BRANCHLESS TRICHOME n=1 Tax=Cannabis sativa TaxID=3483 RepID=A0A7J6E433_CANSA|nr:hypothetical protein F8388_016959 [Cannabis sativa]
MEEEKKKMTMMMMATTTNPTIPESQSWKLYDNPFYDSHQNHNHHHHHSQKLQKQSKNLQCLHIPISARKLAASFWDLTFFRPVMESELDQVKTQMADLKTELECERRARRKLEAMNKRLVKELTEERKGKEEMEKMCEEMAKEISFDKGEIFRMKKEFDEERKMMRVSEVLREERVQMKLAEAKIFLEEKLLEFENSSSSKASKVNSNNDSVCFSGKFRNLVLGNNNNNSDNSIVSSKSYLGHHIDQNDFGNSTGFSSSSSSLQIFPRKSASSESENPHIKRGIKGFVEFPRVVRAIGSKHHRHYWGTKLECQKAQLRIFLNQKNPISSSNNNLVIS